MNKTQSANWTVVSTALRKYKWATVAATFVALFIIVISVLPVIISSQLQKWLLENGADEVSIENVDFNPFTAELAIYDLKIRRQGVETLRLASLQTSVLRLPLFDRQVVIPQILVNELTMSVDLSDPSETRFGGISPAPASPKADESETAAEWTLLVSELRINHHHYTIKKSALLTELKVEKFAIDNLDTGKDAEAFTVNLEASLDGALLNLSGQVQAFSDEPGFKGQYAVEKLDLGKFLTEVDKSFENNSLRVTLDNEVDIKQTAGSGLVFKQSGSSQIDSLKWQQLDTIVESNSLTWEGAISGALTADRKQNLQTDGKLSIEGVQIKEQSGITVSTDSLVWDGAVSGELIADNKQYLHTEGKLNILGAKIKQQAKNLDLENQQFLWDGVVKLSTDSPAAIDIEMDGQLENQALQLRQVDEDIKFTSKRIDWKGNAAVNKADADINIASVSHAVLDELQVRHISNNQGLGSAGRISLDNLKLDSLDKVHFDLLTIENLRMDKSAIFADEALENDFVYKQDELIVEQFDYSASGGIVIKQVLPSTINAMVYRSKSGEWQLEHLLPFYKLAVRQGGSKDEAPQTQQQSDARQKTPLRIDRVALKNTAEVAYIDHMLAEGFTQKIKVDTLELLNVDNNSKVPSPLKLKARLGKASVDVEGTVAVFAPKPEFDLKADIKALSLLSYSHFMEKTLGYQVDSGILNAKSKLVGNSGKLESETDLTLHQLDIRPLTEEELKKLGATQNSGLETGLSMLKDKNDTIELKLPVNGAYEELKVDLGDIINQALGSAMASGAKTYFAAALFPFGTLLVVADMASDEAMRVRLDPVVFTAGTTEFDPKYHEYLKKVAGILEEKPEIFVKVCGVASQSDRDFYVAEMKQAFIAAQKKAGSKEKDKQQKQPEFTVDETLVTNKLTELAKQRAVTVSDFMINKAAVKTERLADCQPRLELEKKDSSPRTDLLL